MLQLPNGVMLSFGPFNGSQHDSSQVSEISLNQLLENYCSFPDKDFLLYSDSGFAISNNIITPFRRNQNYNQAL